jgi:hypothetical protein
MIAQMSSTNGGAVVCATALFISADNYGWPDMPNVDQAWTAAILYRINATTIRLLVQFDNQRPDATMTITGAAQTISAKIRTFIDPLLS